MPTDKSKPPAPCHIGHTRTIKSITGESRAMTIVDEVVVPQGPSKLIYLQKIKWVDRRGYEYRLTYYMIGVKPARKGKWVFGQYSVMIPAATLAKVLRLARDRGWRGI